MGRLRPSRVFMRNASKGILRYAVAEREHPSIRRTGKVSRRRGEGLKFDVAIGLRGAGSRGVYVYFEKGSMRGVCAMGMGGVGQRGAKLCRRVGLLSLGGERGGRRCVGGGNVKEFVHCIEGSRLGSKSRSCRS